MRCGRVGNDSTMRKRVRTATSIFALPASSDATLGELPYVLSPKMHLNFCTAVGHGSGHITTGDIC